MLLLSWRFVKEVNSWLDRLSFLFQFLLLILFVLQIWLVLQLMSFKLFLQNLQILLTHVCLSHSNRVFKFDFLSIKLFALQIIESLLFYHLLLIVSLSLVSFLLCFLLSLCLLFFFNFKLFLAVVDLFSQSFVLIFEFFHFSIFSFFGRALFQFWKFGF